MNTSYIQYTIDSSRGSIIRVKEGYPGPSGKDSTISVDSTVTLQPGSDAYVQNTGTPSEAHLVFGIPQGERGSVGPVGRTSTIQIGTVTSGSSPSVVNVGTDTDAVFNFVLEKGESGYTPVRGVDYWTSADQQYIINEVLSQIPDYEEVSF